MELIHPVAETVDLVGTNPEETDPQHGRPDVTATLPVHASGLPDVKSRSASIDTDHVEQSIEDRDFIIDQALDTLSSVTQGEPVPEPEVRTALRLALPVFLELLGEWKETETERKDARDLVTAFIFFGVLERLWGESLEDLYWYAEEGLLAGRLEDEFGADRL
jgi:hypothetical protein